MSEQLPQFKEIQQSIYSNGAKHLYGVNETGKLAPISHDAVLEAYGHTAAEAKQNRPLNEAELEAQKTQDLIAQHVARATPSMIKTAKAIASAKEQEITPEPAETSASQPSDEKQDFLAPYVAKATPQMRATARAMAQGKPFKPAEQVESVARQEVDQDTKAFLAPYVAKTTPSMQRTAHAMEYGSYPGTKSAEPEADEPRALASPVPVIEVADKPADRPRRTKQLVADKSAEEEYAKYDFSPEWDKDIVDEPDYSDEEYDFSLAWDGYDQKLPLRQRVRNRWNDIKVRAGMLASFNIKGALGTEDPEKERRVMKKLLIGATALSMAGVAAVFIKRGDIDLIPTNGRLVGDGDGVGFDLFGRKLGNGTNSHGVAEIADALTPNGGRSSDGIGESLIPNRGGSGGGASEQAVQSFVVEKGHGYTQEIQDLIPGRTPQQYLAAHEAALKQFGPDYISGVEHYTMPNGDLGLHPGSSTMQPQPEVVEFLKNTLK